MKTFSHLTISRWIIFIMRNISDKSCRENQNTDFMSNNIFRKSWRLWENVEKYDGAIEATNDNATWRTRVACWISKATRRRAHAHAYAPGPPPPPHTHTHTQKRNTGFPWQQWFREHASMLRYTYIVYPGVPPLTRTSTHSCFIFQYETRVLLDCLLNHHHHHHHHQ